MTRNRIMNNSSGHVQHVYSTVKYSVAPALDAEEAGAGAGLENGNWIMSRRGGQSEVGLYHMSRVLGEGMEDNIRKHM